MILLEQEENNYEPKYQTLDEIFDECDAKDKLEWEKEKRFLFHEKKAFDFRLNGGARPFNPNYTPVASNR